MKKAYLLTLGCKVNQFESASFKTEFESNDIAVTSTIDDADIIVVNTCAVTGKASAQSRQEIRRAARRNKHAVIVVTGCHAQLAARDLAGTEGLEETRLRIVGNDQKQLLVAQALDVLPQGALPDLADIAGVREINRLSVNRFGGRTRALLRVQDGCNSYCSYCIVPYTRGPSRSLPPDEVIAQATRYAEAGHREIVITGIHLGNYGRDLSVSLDLAGLTEQICRHLPTVRFRLSSLEPLEISEKLLTLMAGFDNLMPHLHIPLQSGSDDILARMNRRYNQEQFSAVVDRCREKLPDAAIGLDVLVGFPGEQESHFEETRQLIDRLDCTYLHVFPYSRRPGTPAAAYKGQVAKKEKQARVEVLRALGEAKRQEFYRRQRGTARSVLIEAERDSSGSLKGFTDNYIPVRLQGTDKLANTVVIAELGDFDGEAVAARIISLI